MSPKIVDKQAKKQQIIQAAIQVFARYGVAKSKMADIALAAGIGKGTIYEYFRSKEEIFSSAFNTMFAEMEIRLEQVVHSSSSPEVKLKQLIDASIDFYSDEATEFAAIMMDFWAEGIRTKNENILHAIDLKQIYRKFRQLIAKIVKEGIKQGIFRKVDPVSFAAITIAALDGIFLQIIMEPEIINYKKIKETFENSLIAGLLERPI
jgi:AcrR family transcriptional regulator